MDADIREKFIMRLAEYHAKVYLSFLFNLEDGVFTSEEELRAVEKQLGEITMLLWDMTLEDGGDTYTKYLNPPKWDQRLVDIYVKQKTWARVRRLISYAG